MKIRGLIDEDFVNYKLPSMSIQFPFCSFKCGKENCQNYPARNNPIYSVQEEYIAYRYYTNKLTKAIVFNGFEPFDSGEEIFQLIKAIRKLCDDDIVIYTGYNKEELTELMPLLTNYSNIIIKYGRYMPDLESKYDSVLGVHLSSSNQYAEKIS